MSEVTYPPQAGFGALAIDQREPWVLAPDFWNSVSAAEGALYLGSCRHARAFSNRAVCRACRVSGPNALQIPGCVIWPTPAPVESRKQPPQTFTWGNLRASAAI